MRPFKHLHLIHFNSKIIGADGDCHVFFFIEPDLGIVIGIIPELFISLQSPTLTEFFAAAHQAVEDFLSELSTIEDPESWAAENHIPIYFIPNFLSLKRKRPRMPRLVFCEEETLKDLEDQVRLN